MAPCIIDFIGASGYFKIDEIYEIYMKSIYILQLQRNTYFEITEIYRKSIIHTGYVVQKKQSIKLVVFITNIWERAREKEVTPQESRVQMALTLAVWCELAVKSPSPPNLPQPVEISITTQQYGPWIHLIYLYIKIFYVAACRLVTQNVWFLEWRLDRTLLFSLGSLKEGWNNSMRGYMYSERGHESTWLLECWWAMPSFLDVAHDQWGRSLEGRPNTAARMLGWRRVTRQVWFCAWWTSHTTCFFRTVPVPLTGAAQLRVDGISSCCGYIINVHNHPPWATSRQEGTAWYSSRPLPSLCSWRCLVYN